MSVGTRTISFRGLRKRAGYRLPSEARNGNAAGRTEPPSGGTFARQGPPIARLRRRSAVAMPDRPWPNSSTLPRPAGGGLLERFLPRQPAAPPDDSQCQQLARGSLPQIDFHPVGAVRYDQTCATPMDFRVARDLYAERLRSCRGFGQCARWKPVDPSIASGVSRVLMIFASNAGQSRLNTNDTRMTIGSSGSSGFGEANRVVRGLLSRHYRSGSGRSLDARSREEMCMQDSSANPNVPNSRRLWRGHLCSSISIYQTLGDLFLFNVKP